MELRHGNNTSKGNEWDAMPLYLNRSPLRVATAELVTQQSRP